MESTCFGSSFLLKFNPFSQNRNLSKIVNREKRFSNKISASSYRETHGQGHRGGRLVDENMIVLRKRIHEMRVVERNYEAPSHWMKWEKQYYTSYDSMICEMMGILQSQLMNMRPSLALGTVALVFLSVPISAAVVGFHLVEMAKWVLTATHMG